MKRWFFIGLIALLSGAWLFQKIASGSGYVLISLGNTAYEMSFWTAVGILAGGLFCLLLGYWLVSALIKLVGGSAKQLLHVGRKNNQQRMARGLIDFIEGNWKQARRRLLKSANHSDNAMINYLAAARSTYELGNHEEAIELLHLAEKSNPDSTLAVALTQARMYLADKKHEQCMANLKRAREIAPHHPVVLDLLQQNFLQLQDWQALRELIPDLRRYKILAEQDITDLEVRLYRALINDGGIHGNVADLDQQWEAIPKALRKNTTVFMAFVKQLIALGEQARAENLLRKQLDQHWDDILVDYFGRVVGSDSKRQFLFAKDWLKSRPGNATLLLVLGRLAMRNEQWQEARDYFSASIQLQKRAESCGELARLLYALGETEEATRYYQLALTNSESSLPELPLPVSGTAASPQLRVVKE